jgi:hypothetical protein
MPCSVQERLDRFDRLAEAEKHEAASEILQRVRASRVSLDVETKFVEFHNDGFWTVAAERALARVVGSSSASARAREPSR